MLQTIIVGLVLALVCLWLGRRWWRQLSGPAPCGGCGCGGCGDKPGPEPRPLTDLLTKKESCKCENRS